MTIVQVAGEGDVEFPDDMSDAEIEAALQKIFADKKDAANDSVGGEVAPAADTPKPKGDPRRSLVEGLAAVATSIGAEIAAGLSSAVVAPVAGVDKAVEVQDKITGSAAEFSRPRSEGGQNFVEKVGKAGEVITGAVRAPVAGLAGLFNLPRGLDAAADVTRRVQDEGIGATAAGAVLDATGSPGVAAAVETVPTGLATLFGFKGVKKLPDVKPGPVDPKIHIPKAADDAAKVEKTAETGTKSAEQLSKDVGRGKTAKVVENVLPDPEIIEAAKRLGVDLNPEHYSTSAAFQEVARALKAKGARGLEETERLALRKLSDKADELVIDLGGSTDKAGVSASIANDLKSTITKMEDAAEILYGKVDTAIPKATRIEPNSIRAYLEQKLVELGGKSNLTAAESKLLDLVQNKKGEPITPTYAALDRVRKDIGSGFNKRSGPFKDDNTGVLRQVYRVMSDDQQAVSRLFGIEDTYVAARSVVAKRKGIEDQAVELFGRSMNESLVPKLRTAAVALAKGDVSKFTKLMDALPEARRAEVAATLLNDIFAAGSRSGSGLGQSFVSTFNALNKNGTAKAEIFKFLPKDAESRFNDIGKVYSAIIKANQRPLSNPSGSAAPIVAALESGTFLSKIYGFAKQAVPAEAATTFSGVPGLGIGAVILKATRKSSATRTPAIAAADEFLTSQAFQKSINKALDGDVAAANGILTSSQKFKKWVGTLDAQNSQRIANEGFIAWLVSNEEQ